MITEMLLYINDDNFQLLKGEVRGNQRLVKGLLYIFHQPLVHPSPPWRLGEVEVLRRSLEVFHSFLFYGPMLPSPRKVAALSEIIIRGLVRRVIKVLSFF